MSQRVVTIVFSVIAVLLMNPALGSNSALSLDLLNPDRAHDSELRPYMILLRKQIQDVWLPTSSSNSRHVSIYFEVAPSGELQSISIDKTSGDTNLDNSAVDSVRSVKPVARSPQNTTLKVLATFNSSRKEVSPQLRTTDLPIATNQSVSLDKSSPNIEQASVNKTPITLYARRDDEQLTSANSFPLSTTRLQSAVNLSPVRVEVGQFMPQRPQRLYGNQLMMNNNHGQFVMGVVGMQITPNGVVQRVFPGSDVNNFDVRPGDRVVAYNGHPYVSGKNFVDECEGIPGTTVEVSFFRFGQVITFPIRRTDARFYVPYQHTGYSHIRDAVNQYRSW